MTAEKSVRVVCSVCGRDSAGWSLNYRRGYNIAKHKGPRRGVTPATTCLGYWRTDHELVKQEAT